MQQAGPAMQSRMHCGVTVRLARHNLLLENFHAYHPISQCASL